MAWATLGSDTTIRAQIYNKNGGKVGNEIQVARGAAINKGKDVTSPRVTTLANGRFVVVWQSYTPNKYRYDVSGQVFSGTGARVGRAFKVKSKKGWENKQPDVAAIGNNFVVIWSANDSGSGHGVHGQRYSAGGKTKGKPFRITATGKKPAIAAISGKRYFVAWDDYSGAIKGQRLKATGKAIGKAIMVASKAQAEAEQQYLSVASLPNSKRFVVFWRAETNSVFVYALNGRVYNQKGKLVRQFHVADSYNQGTPWVSASATLDSGRVVVTWGDEGGFFDTINLRTITPDGKLAGGIVQANSVYEGGKPAIAPAGPDRFIVAWEGLSPTADNIYGVIFQDD